MGKIDIAGELSADNIRMLVSGMNRRLEKIYLGGGEKKLEKIKS